MGLGIRQRPASAASVRVSVERGPKHAPTFDIPDPMMPAAEEEEVGGRVVAFPALRPATGIFVDHRWCLSSSSKVFVSCWSAHPLYPASRSTSQPNSPLLLIAHFLTAS